VRARLSPHSPHQPPATYLLSRGFRYSPSRGGSDGPELVGCVSCASCAVWKLKVKVKKSKVKKNFFCGLNVPWRRIIGPKLPSKTKTFPDPARYITHHAPRGCSPHAPSARRFTAVARGELHCDARQRDAGDSHKYPSQTATTARAAASQLRLHQAPNSTAARAHRKQAGTGMQQSRSGGKRPAGDHIRLPGSGSDAHIRHSTSGLLDARIRANHHTPLQKAHCGHLLRGAAAAALISPMRPAAPVTTVRVVMAWWQGGGRAAAPAAIAGPQGNKFVWRLGALYPGSSGPPSVHVA
jgi:hypothetical protein